MQFGEKKKMSGGDHLKRSELDLFKDFYQEVMGLEIEPESAKAFEQTVAALRQDEREA